MAAGISFAQVPKPADPQKEPIAITNATIHIGNGDVIENGVIKFTDGKIDEVRTSGADLDGYRVIDATGKDIYPGFILPSTNLGLEDVGAVRATRDYNEVGSITPNVRAQIAYNTDTHIIHTFRFNGIVLAQSTPQGGLITGTSSIMVLDGWNWEDATYVVDDAIHIDWPSKTYGPRWWRGETERRPNNNYNEQVNSIVSAIKDARAYVDENPSDINLKLEAMRGVISGDQKVFLYADRAEQIVSSITTLIDNGITNIVLVGGRDAYYVSALLKDNNIPVVLDNIHRMPSRPEEAVDFPFRLPGLLTEAGITVALRHDGMLSRGRNLPFYAGTSAAHGMNKEDALSMITLNAAKVLGIEEKAGTLEVGKDAHILISKGDILDMKSSIIEKVYISGKEIEMEGKQQILYQRFNEKYSK